MMVKRFVVLFISIVVASAVIADETVQPAKTVPEAQGADQHGDELPRHPFLRQNAAPQLNAARATPMIVATPAGDVSAGTFGANQGGGNYIFPQAVGFGGTTYTLGMLNLVSNIAADQYYGAFIQAYRTNGSGSKNAGWLLR